MRVSPVGWAFETLDEVIDEAKRSAEVTHNHHEGIKGAQVTAATVFGARTGASREKLRELVHKLSDYNLDRSVDEVREVYKYNETCQETVPEAIIAFLESTDFEDAIRKAISLGGDSDTLACITGGIAEAFYGGVPASIATKVFDRLNPHLRQIVNQFDRRFMNGRYKTHY
jgi:ADP-ribosylglycohydrolase